MGILVKSVAGMILIVCSGASQAMTAWIVSSGQNPFSNSQSELALTSGVNSLDLYYDVQGDTSYGYDFVLEIVGSGSISNVTGGDSDLGDVYGVGWRQFGGDIYGETGSSVLAFSFDFFANAGTSLLISGSYTDANFLDASMISSTLGSVAVSAVPVPAAVWLFGSGLIGLIGFARRKKA
ncbi:MAG: VPLPA-CTERM sorting domain-containing protein [Gammaproteobacteria bacterium]|nr:VPLPA-CTERM sorting domain-containing protein [Gammaproteobacteria bacterium]